MCSCFYMLHVTSWPYSALHATRHRSDRIFWDSGVHPLLNVLHKLQGRGVEFQSLTEAIDTATPTGRAMLHMVVLLGELERGLIAERTRAGVKAAQAKHARMQIEQGERVQDVAALLNVGRMTLYRALQRV